MKIEVDVPIKVRLEFNRKNNIFIGDSATGKTYLSKLLLKHSFLNKYNVLIIDYTTVNMDIADSIVRSTNKENSILFIDNCDLLDSRGFDVYSIISNSCCTNMIYVKDLTSIDYLKIKDMSLQVLYFNDDVLFNEEICKW